MSSAIKHAIAYEVGGKYVNGERSVLKVGSQVPSGKPVMGRIQREAKINKIKLPLLTD